MIQGDLSVVAEKYKTNGSHLPREEVEINFRV